MHELTVIVNKSNGLHVRMAAALIQKLQSLIQDTASLSRIYISCNDKKVPVVSLLLLVSLKIRRGDKITIHFDMEVTENVLEEVRAFVESQDMLHSPEQDQTDRLLMENSVAVESVLSSLPNGIVVVNKENIITYVNSEAYRLLGLPPESLINQKANEIIPHSRLHVVMETGESELGKKHVIGKHVIITSRSPLYYEGKIEGAVALFQDISVVEELSKELKDIKELKQQLDLVLHSVEDYISLTNQKGDFLYSNKQMQDFLRKENLLPNVPSIISREKWDRVFKIKQPETYLLTFQSLSYITKLNPVIIDTEFYGAVLTINPLNEVKTLVNQLEIEKERTRYLELELSRHETLNRAFTKIVGNSDPLMESLFIANRVAKLDSTILITGESGTGKELVAKAIHEASARSTKPFIRVNCAAIPATLMESELFGHEKGAFTGANQLRRGKFELANTGTIFLDEIGDLGFDLQVKLLRVLQEREIERIGGQRTISLNVRIIAATNRDLNQMVQDGTFREDLYYRLNVIPIHLPPLRKRLADIPLLVDMFMKQLNERLGTSIETYEKAFLDAFLSYQWPGNIRELQNILERTMTLSDEKILRVKYLPDYIRIVRHSNRHELAVGAGIRFQENMIQSFEEYEIEIYRHVVQYYPSFNSIAKALGVTHKTVANKVRKYRLEDLVGRKYQEA